MARRSGPYRLHLRGLSYQWHLQDDRCGTLDEVWRNAAAMDHLDEVTGVAIIDNDGRLTTHFGPSMKRSMAEARQGTLEL